MSISIGKIVITGFNLIIFIFAIIFTCIAAFLVLNIDALINWLPEDMFDLIKGAKTMAFLVFGGLAVLFWFITIYNLKKS